MFESFVNSERCKTIIAAILGKSGFESFVNSERCKTNCYCAHFGGGFESFVNSERCKTIPRSKFNHVGLRALLIRKDVKHLRLSSHTL